MVHVKVISKKVTVEVRDGNILEDNNSFESSLMSLIKDNSYKLERYELERDLSNLSNNPLTLTVHYESEVLSNSVGKLIELWVGTRGIEVELEN